MYASIKTDSFFNELKTDCFIFSPFSFYNEATSAGLQTEHTLLPGTFHPETCSIQPWKQRSDVIPTASFARSQTGILLSVLH